MDAYTCQCGQTLTMQPGIRLACCDEPKQFKPAVRLGDRVQAVHITVRIGQGRLSAPIPLVQPKLLFLMDELLALGAAVDINWHNEPGEKPVTAMLPLLLEEELAELHDAIKERMNTLAQVRLGMVHAGNDELVEITDHKGLVLQSLDTAVQEARSHLR